MTHKFSLMSKSLYFFKSPPHQTAKKIPNATAGLNGDPVTTPNDILKANKAAYVAEIIIVVIAGSPESLVFSSVCVRYRNVKSKEPRTSKRIAWMIK